MIVDAHHHVWRTARGDYGWLADAPSSLRGDFTMADLAPALSACGVDATVLVQAAPTEAETAFLLDVADSSERVAAVVGWADLEAPDVADRLARLRDRPKLRGVRPMIQDIADPDWMLSPAAALGFAALEASGLRLDALVRPRHLAALDTLAERHPGLPITVDHAAKPDVAASALQPWADDIARLAQRTQFVCKLSGLITEAGGRTGDEDLAPFVDHVLRTFGPARLMWGSDWPVLTPVADYAAWFAQAQRLMRALDDEARARVFGGTATSFYDLEETR